MSVLDTADLKLMDRHYHRTIMGMLLNAFSDGLICIAVAIGLYTRWITYGYVIIFALGLCGLFVVAVNLALRYYFAVSAFDPLVQIWLMACVFLVGLWDSFHLTTPHKHLDDVMNIFFVAGSISNILIECFFIVCRKSKGAEATQHPLPLNSQNILSSDDYSRITGVLAACVAFGGSNVLPLICIIFALSTNLIAVKLKSVLSVLNIICMCALTEIYLFPALNLSINPYAIICGLCKFYSKPILELFACLSNTGRLELYVQTLLLRRRVYLRFLLIIYLAVEFLFFYSHASVVRNHKEWYIVVPMFVLVSIFWFLTKILTLIVLYTLINKFDECKQHLGQILDTVMLKRVLSARGLRYFSLIARKLTYATVFATLLVGALCWTTRNYFNHALSSVVLACQILVCELLNEFTYNLGGTCVGFAVVAPVSLVRNDGLVSVLPPNFVEEIRLRSMTCLQSVVQFFAHHMIVSNHCGWSISGLEWSEMQKKLTTFFQQCTNEGPPFDTYVLYYSGPVTDKGDWALTDNAVISLDNLLELWRESREMRGGGGTGKNGKNSRLLLICDCEYSAAWMKPVRNVPTGVYLGLQTFDCTPNKRSLTILQDDIESGFSGSEQQQIRSLGDFTRLWVEYNSTGNKSLFETLAPDLRPCYQVSKSWPDFNFHFPSAREIRDYWQNYLPRCAHPLLGLIVGPVSLPVPGGVFSACFSCSKLFKRWRLKMFPPSELDTGHGFKLLRM